MIRDIIVFGVNNKQLREKLINEGEVTNSISQMCVQDNSDEDDSWMDSYFKDTVGHTQSSASDRVFVNLGIGPHFHNIRFKIDTGSSVSTLPNRHLTSYSGNKIQVDGNINLACKYRWKTVNTTFYVVNSEAPPLIGLQTSVDLGLIQLTYAIGRKNGQSVNKEYFMSEYSDLKGVGILPGKGQLCLREDAVLTGNSATKTPTGSFKVTFKSWTRSNGQISNHIAS